jgi:hypothetical protein
LICERSQAFLEVVLAIQINGDNGYFRFHSGSSRGLVIDGRMGKQDELVGEETRHAAGHERNHVPRVVPNSFSGAGPARPTSPERGTVSRGCKRWVNPLILN